jgi:transposase
VTKLEIEKLRRQLYGARSTARLLELQLEERKQPPPRTNWRPSRRRRDRRPSSRSSARGHRANRSSDHSPRERVVVAAPAAAPCCGSDRLSKLGEDIAETLEVVPRKWKVIQTVRDKFSCRG